ncbi:MAG: hypothetical protein AAFR67_06105 [Chloroflexota bacterium]
MNGHEDFIQVPFDIQYGAICGVRYAERFIPRGFRPTTRILP